MGLIDKDPSEQSNPYLKIIFGVALGVGLTLLFSKIWNHEYGPQDKPRHSVDSSRSVGSLAPPASPYQDPIGREERALAVTKLESFREQANSVLEALKVLEKEITKWEVEVEPLLFNRDGKWIAADEALVRYFQKVMSEDRKTSINVSSIRTQVDEILTPVIQAIQDPTELYVPSIELSKTLSKLHSDVYYGAKNYQKQRSQILAMVEDARVSGGEPASISLQTSIARLEGEKTRRQAELISKREKEAEEQIAQRLAAMRKQTLEKEAAAEEKILLARQKLADQKSERERTSLEAQRYRVMAEDTNVQKQFSPFLAKGRYKGYTRGRSAYGSIPTWEHAKSLSASYDALKRFGVYHSVDEFVKFATNDRIISAVDGGLHWTNDRPIWSKPRTAKDWENYQEKWELFKKLTPYWLESGVLSK